MACYLSEMMPQQWGSHNTARIPAEWSVRRLTALLAGEYVRFNHLIGLALYSKESHHSHGIAEFILKPLILNDLAHTIRRVLDRPVPLARVLSDSAPSVVPSEVSSEELDAVGPRR